MKYLPLIWANLFRKKLRTAFTVGSFAVALFLFGFLGVIHNAFGGGVKAAGVDRLMVINKTSIIQPLPISYRDQMLRIPGVQAVSFDIWFGGIYQNPKNFFPTLRLIRITSRKSIRSSLCPMISGRLFLRTVKAPSSARDSRSAITGKWEIEFR